MSDVKVITSTSSASLASELRLLIPEQLQLNSVHLFMTTDSDLTSAAVSRAPVCFNLKEQCSRFSAADHGSSCVDSTAVHVCVFPGVVS